MNLVGQSLYLLPVLAALGVCLGIARRAWRHRPVPGAAAFTVVVLCQVSWIAGFVIEMLSPTLAGKLFWDNLQWGAALFWPAAALMFARDYTGRRARASLWGLLAIPIVAFMGVVFTDPSHGWLTGGTARLAPGATFTFLYYELGPAVWAALAYFYFVAGAALVLLVQYRGRQALAFRRQTTVILAACLALAGYPLYSSCPTIVLEAANSYLLS